RHDGSIWVESGPGQGTVFTVRLPRGETGGGAVERVAWPNASSESITSPPYAGDTGVDASTETMSGVEDPEAPLVLVAEDDRDLLKYLLELLGERYRTAGAVHGLDALDKARSLHPDLLLTDVMMPHMSGRDLFEALQGDPGLKDIPCVFLTAMTAGGVRLDSLSHGVSDYVHKPFEDDELLARIDNLLRIHGLARELEKRVEEQTSELRQMAVNLSSVQEEERKRIAREIHDELGQVLSGLRMELDRLRLLSGEPASDDVVISNSFDRMYGLFDSLHESIHHVIDALIPGALSSQGFVAAVEGLCRDYEHRSGVPCEVDLGIDDENLDTGVSIALYRIVQEALSNIARHARPNSVQVRMEDNEGRLTLLIRDDGAGFEAGSLAHEGFGLLGIRERARQLGGEMSILSSSGHGTEVTVSIPGQAASSVGQS
ncbi:MAG: response regulator, partial [Deltaproteobacteria bacterium]|nr:response regulator [Deltaproteobacteria bacterium]